MSKTSNRWFYGFTAARQRFSSLFARSEREVVRYGACPAPNIFDANDIARNITLTR
jgi:hypothetical protein